MIQFLTKTQTIKKIKGNDNYYDTFSKNDWNLRGMRNKEDYLSIIPFCCCDFTEGEKKRLEILCQKADEFFKSLDEIYEWLNGNLLSKIKWKIACIISYKDEYKYENENPHTIDDTILLPRTELENDDQSLISLLIHEKIHIFQRFYPMYVKKYIKLRQFKKYQKRKVYKKYKKIRANPDVDSYIYERFGRIYHAIYRKGATSINDIHIKKLEMEHPYEEMAYRVEEMYKYS